MEERKNKTRRKLKIQTVSEVEKEALVASIKRRARIQAIEDYSGVIITKGTGLAGIVAGGIEMLDPNILALDSTQGLYALGIGTAFVGGRKVITILKNFFGSFDKDDNEEKK